MLPIVLICIVSFRKDLHHNSSSSFLPQFLSFEFYFPSTRPPSPSSRLIEIRGDGGKGGLLIRGQVNKGEVDTIGK